MIVYQRLFCILTIAVAVYGEGQDRFLLTTQEKEDSCLATGGTVDTGKCCKSVSDFPNGCGYDCSCTTSQSKTVTICRCPRNMCFDGSACVPQASSLSCTDSGGTSDTIMCCPQTKDWPNTCESGACDCPKGQGHPTQVCTCPSGECFDGISCVPQTSYSGCRALGGHGSWELCCKNTAPFPDNCLIGACGCSLKNSALTSVCECKSNNQCFNGEKCVDRGPIDDCMSSGGTPSTALCCMSQGDYPNMCQNPGACQCSQGLSAQRDVCLCPQNTCFNGQFCVDDGQRNAKGCRGSGGTVALKQACQNDPYPDTCLNPGAFDCPNGKSFLVEACVCPSSKCFDATLNQCVGSPITPCFPGDSLVDVRNKGMVLVSELRIGDCVSVGKHDCEPIYSFGHYDPSLEASFLKFQTDESSLKISPDHMLFIKGKGYVPASLVTVGDSLVNDRGLVQDVKSVKSIKAKGLYAPFTPSGKLVVDGVVVSSYMAFDDTASVAILPGLRLSYQWLAHAFEFPHRVVCHYLRKCPKERYTKDGISTWVACPFKIAKWILGRHWFLRSILLSLFVALLLLFEVVETFVQYPILMVGLFVSDFVTRKSRSND